MPERRKPTGMPQTKILPQDDSPLLYTLHLGDCLEVLRTMPANSVDSIVCDPPYGLGKAPDIAQVLAKWLADEPVKPAGTGFMNLSWDAFVPGPEVWREALRVLKPGGHLLAFFGSRTYDLGTLAIRLAGFEIRDQIMWLYGSGFPKSLDVSRALDKAAGAEREVTGITSAPNGNAAGYSGGRYKEKRQTRFGVVQDQPDKTAPATDAARQWSGWGTALKPAHEPICVARKPLIGTVAANVLKHGTGALNIDACRVPAEGGASPSAEKRATAKRTGNAPGRPGEYGATLVSRTTPERYTQARPGEALGRWPANLILDGSEEVLEAFPDAPGQMAKVKGTEPTANGFSGAVMYGGFMGRRESADPRQEDSKTAARFFYCAKASRKDRNEGLKDPGPQFKHGTTLRKVENAQTAGNTHPTVKPTSLMQYLCRLVTPPGGVVLDLYMGSGSTGKAAILEGFQFIGIEREPEYLEIARARIAWAYAKRPTEGD